MGRLPLYFQADVTVDQVKELIDDAPEVLPKHDSLNWILTYREILKLKELFASPPPPERDIYEEMCERNLTLEEIRRGYVQRLHERRCSYSEIHRITGLARDTIRLIVEGES